MSVPAGGRGNGGRLHNSGAEPSRPVASFPLNPAQRAQYARAGFETLQDVLELSPSELSAELNITMQQAVQHLQLFRGELDAPGAGVGAGTGSGAGLMDSNATTEDEDSIPSVGEAGAAVVRHVDKRRRIEEGPPSSPVVGATLLEVLKQERARKPIVTFSPHLDSMLGGGVPLAKMTEFCGAPGIGKTQLGIQLAVDVQIPAEFGGVGGEAVYIDTEGSFVADRAAEIASAAVEHVQSIAASQHKEETAAAVGFSTKSILSGIHLYRVHNFAEQLAVVQLLRDFCRSRPKVKLVVIDSIAFHFRHNFDDMALRTRVLNGMAQDLLRLATDFEAALVLMNQMTTKLSRDGAKSQLAPALGESWGHAATIRVILAWRDGQRCATLCKSPSHAEATVTYAVTAAGIRGLDLSDSER